jgi:hypothetical protein
MPDVIDGPPGPPPLPEEEPEPKPEPAAEPRPAKGNGSSEEEFLPESLLLEDEDRVARLKREGKLKPVLAFNKVRPTPPPVLPKGLQRKAKAKAPKTDFEAGPSFMSRVLALPPIGWHAEGLIPGEGVTLFHGRPRAMKSLSLLRIAFDLASGRDLFGTPRFHVARPVRTLYLTEEDPDRLLGSRMELHRRGAGTATLPENLFFSVRQGLSLDNPDHRLTLRRALEHHGIEVAIFEPIRSLTSSAEGTSGDFKEVADWIRSVQAQTCCKTFVPAAHWRKPQQWERKGGDSQLADKVAGGALFSFSDCLVGCEKVDGNSAVLIPSHYKLGADPKPFVVTWTTEATTGTSGESLFGPSITPAIDEAESVEEVRGRQDRQIILDFICSHPWLTMHRIAESLHRRPGTTLEQIGHLLDRKVVVCVKHKRAKLYARHGEEFDASKLP